MKNNDDYILIPRQQVARFLRDYVIANYAMQMFSYLATEKQLEIHINTDEICSLLNITREKLEVFRRKGEIKSFTLGGVRFYSAFDIAKVAEVINRPKRFRLLSRLPSVRLSEDKM
jgi:hypothetical protein